MAKPKKDVHPRTPKPKKNTPPPPSRCGRCGDVHSYDGYCGSWQ